MFLTKDFLFTHVPKCGGSYVITQLRQNKIVNLVKPTHENFERRNIDLEEIDLKFGLIRNPWDWYVSYYTHCNLKKSLGIGGRTFKDASKNYTLDFKATITNLLTNINSYDYLNGSNTTYEIKNVSYNIGLLGTYYIYHFCGKDGFIKLLQNEGVPESKFTIGKMEDMYEFLNNIFGSKLKFEDVVINGNSHSHYTEYYDSELRELVAMKEEYIIKKFEY